MLPTAVWTRIEMCRYFFVKASLDYISNFKGTPQIQHKILTTTGNPQYVPEPA